MDNLAVALNAVAPIFLLLILGYFLKRVMRLGQDTVQVLNRLCFKVFLPVLFFKNIYTTDLSSAVNLRLILFAMGTILVLFLAVSVLVPRFEPKRNRQGVLIQGIFRSNFIILGLPICATLYGEEHLGEISMLAAVVVPLFNVLAVWTLTVHGTEGASKRRVLKNVLTNPLILAAAAGCLFLALQIQLPSFLLSTVKDLSGVATPLSILVLGAGLDFGRVQQNGTAIAAAVGCRLLLVPAAVLLLAWALGFRNTEMVALMAVFGTPTAVSSYTMAEQMGGDGDLAGQLVMFSSALSSFTLFLLIAVLKSVGAI